jgi:hypothetical protein
MTWITRIFPAGLILLNCGASVGYLVNGQYKLAAYHLLCALCNVCINF